MTDPLPFMCLVQVANREHKRLKKSSEHHPSYAMSRAYLETLADLPWNTFSSGHTNPTHAASQSGNKQTLKGKTVPLCFDWSQRMCTSQGWEPSCICRHSMQRNSVYVPALLPTRLVTWNGMTWSHCSWCMCAMVCASGTLHLLDLLLQEGSILKQVAYTGPEDTTSRGKHTDGASKADTAVQEPSQPRDAGQLSLAEARALLDKDHYGLDKVPIKQQSIA